MSPNGMPPRGGMNQPMPRYQRGGGGMPPQGALPPGGPQQAGGPPTPRGGFQGMAGPQQGQPQQRMPAPWMQQQGAAAPGASPHSRCLPGARLLPIRRLPLLTAAWPVQPRSPSRRNPNHSHKCRASRAEECRRRGCREVAASHKASKCVRRCNLDRRDNRAACSGRCIRAKEGDPARECSSKAFNSQGTRKVSSPARNRSRGSHKCSRCRAPPMEFTADELEQLAETHEVFKLTEEEERMVFAFREFKDRKHKPGAVFSWQTHPDIPGGELPRRLWTPR